ncbi:5032_t:CDS:1, partial [Scutellospora calospora]
KNIPDTIHNTNIVANQNDYHGNFNSEIFKNLFEKLCADIKDQYRSIDIHIDRACYYKHQAEQVLTSNSKKDVLHI